jgi:two-component system CitB family response regulator/two-component system response regulator DcuR
MIKVLIVEDDINVSTLHRKFTEKVEGFEVVGIANSIEDAYEMADIFRPELILLDLYFPESSGMEFLWKLRQEGHQTDVILITASRDPNVLQEAVRGGAFDFIVKPVIFDRFKKSLEKFKTYKSEVCKVVSLEQDDVDSLLDRHVEHVEAVSEMPKGIDPITLKKVMKVFEKAQEALSAEEVGKLIGASRNTARRYLDYLTSNGFVEVDIDYGTVGRPEKRFRIKK